MSVIPFTSWRVRCGNCFRWMRRARLCDDVPYCSYTCGVVAQPEHCASSWGFTSTPGLRT